jgi:large subunit ribosomal protein L20
MPRVKRGVSHVKRRKNILKRTKSFRWGRKNRIKLAKVAVLKAGKHAYIGRKLKKRNNRALWQIKISAATQAHGLSYSKFIGQLKKNNINLDRKILADIAEHNPNIFAKIVSSVK